MQIETKQKGVAEDDDDDDPADDEDDDGVLSTKKASGKENMSKKHIIKKRATLPKLRQRLRRGADQDVEVFRHNSPGGLPHSKVNGHNPPGGLPKQADGRFHPATASGNRADKLPERGAVPVYRCCRERKDEKARQRRKVQKLRNLIKKTFKTKRRHRRLPETMTTTMMMMKK